MTKLLVGANQPAVFPRRGFRWVLLSICSLSLIACGAGTNGVAVSGSGQTQVSKYDEKLAADLDDPQLLAQIKDRMQNRVLDEETKCSKYFTVNFVKMIGKSISGNRARITIDANITNKLIYFDIDGGNVEPESRLADCFGSTPAGWSPGVTLTMQEDFSLSLKNSRWELND
jgi:hypothetical protein